jgi:hypothetical protein
MRRILGSPFERVNELLQISVGQKPVLQIRCIGLEVRLLPCECLHGSRNLLRYCRGQFCHIDSGGKCDHLSGDFGERLAGIILAAGVPPRHVPKWNPLMLGVSGKAPEELHLPKLQL